MDKNINNQFFWLDYFHKQILLFFIEIQFFYLEKNPAGTPGIKYIAWIKMKLKSTNKSRKNIFIFYFQLDNHHCFIHRKKACFDKYPLWYYFCETNKKWCLFDVDRNIGNFVCLFRVIIIMRKPFMKLECRKFMLINN